MITIISCDSTEDSTQEEVHTSFLSNYAAQEPQMFFILIVKLPYINISFQQQVSLSLHSAYCQDNGRATVTPDTHL